MLALAPLLALAAVPIQAQPDPDAGAAVPDGLEWPRVINTERAQVVVYQPQIETFAGVEITARAAVSVTPSATGESADEGGVEPRFGSVWFTARIETDRVERTARMVELEVFGATFVGATEEELAALSQVLVEDIGNWDPVLSLDRLLTALELAEMERTTAEKLEHAPPRIVFVDHPALLVTVDGTPRLQLVEGSTVMRVANSPFLILFDPASSTYFLTDGATWLASPRIEGPWKNAPDPSQAVAEIVPGASGVDPGAEGGPQIVVATEPTELIVTDGEPLYEPIEPTGLFYVANTARDVLLDSATQRIYVLLSGRWYSAPSTDGEWVFVPPDELPEDFARIPADSPVGYVRASVAGTREALDALLELSIPQTATIDRRTASIEVAYDGKPRFVPVARSDSIDGPVVQYAVNTEADVLRVEDDYYCCSDAVWFSASDPNGPWVVCTKVPDAIYTIPPSCPLYDVRFAHVYDSTAEEVLVWYTPGYVGCYVHRGVVVYGTGYSYRPWYRTSWFAGPHTWGFAFTYDPYTGSWGVGVSYRGVLIAQHSDWWGPGGYRNWVAAATHTVETPMGRFIRETELAQELGELDADREAYVEPNENVYRRREQRLAGREARPDSPGAPEAIALNLANDVFVDSKGNLYRRTRNGWQRHDADGWTPIRLVAPSAKAGEIWPPKAPLTEPPPTNIGRQFGVRSRGSSRTNQFRSQVGRRATYRVNRRRRR